MLIHTGEIIYWSDIYATMKETIESQIDEQISTHSMEHGDICLLFIINMRTSLICYQHKDVSHLLYFPTMVLPFSYFSLAGRVHCRPAGEVGRASMKTIYFSWNFSWKSWKNWYYLQIAPPSSEISKFPFIIKYWWNFIWNIFIKHHHHSHTTE